MKFTDLDNITKAKKVQNYDFCHRYTQYVEKYINALINDEVEVIEQFEQFGDNIRQIIENKRTYEQNLLWGFDYIRFNEYGWFDREQFRNMEKIPFVWEKKSNTQNFIEIGQSPNGKWAYGIWHSTGAAGGVSGISVWGIQYNSRKECLLAGLSKLMEVHQYGMDNSETDSCGNYNFRLCKEIFSLAKKMYDEITGRRGIQLDLFAVA